MRQESIVEPIENNQAYAREIRPGESLEDARVRELHDSMVEPMPLSRTAEFGREATASYHQEDNQSIVEPCVEQLAP
jgi:hypothetical protein